MISCIFGHPRPILLPPSSSQSTSRSLQREGSSEDRQSSSMSVARRAATVVALWHGRRLLTALAESKEVALGMAKGCKAESSMLSTMAVASHAAKSPVCMGTLVVRVS
ncbi:hypothetical protein BHM03_00048024 [Ensete ventricosum]|nr:hypothetical protein BHM03_00048024 [Ensete ventricosum]